LLQDANAREDLMSVAKIIELVGSSDVSWDEAVRAAVAEAARTVRGIRGVDVQDWTARVKDGRIVEYKANVKIAFGVEEEHPA
jgi:dodecin